MPGRFGGLPEIPQETLGPGKAPAQSGPGWAEYGDYTVKVTDKSEQNITPARESRATRAQRRDALDHSMWESFQAGLMETIPAKVLAATWYGRPDFKDDTPINHHTYLQNTPMALTEAEREFFMDNARGQKSAEWAIERIKDWRRVRETESSHAAVAFGSAMLDPVNVVPGGAAVRFAGGVRNRLVAGAITGAANAGLESVMSPLGSNPVESDEVVSAGILGGITGMFYRARAPKVKPHPATADAPQATPAPQGPQKPVGGPVAASKVTTPPIAPERPVGPSRGPVSGLLESPNPDMPPYYWGAPRLEAPEVKPVSLPDPSITLRLEGPAQGIVGRAEVVQVREPDIQVVEGPALLENPQTALFYDKNANAEDVAFKDVDPKTSPVVHLTQEEIDGLGLPPDIKMPVEDPAAVAKILRASANDDLGGVHMEPIRFGKRKVEAANDETVGGIRGPSNEEHWGRAVNDATAANATDFGNPNPWEKTSKYTASANDVEYTRPALPEPVRHKLLEYKDRAEETIKEVKAQLETTKADAEAKAAEAHPRNMERKVAQAAARSATEARKKANAEARAAAKAQREAHAESMRAAQEAERFAKAAESAANKAAAEAEARVRKAEAKVKAAEAKAAAAEAKAKLQAERAAKHAEAKAAAAQRKADQAVFKAKQAQAKAQAQNASQKAQNGPTSASVSQGSTTTSGMSPNASAVHKAAQHTAAQQASTTAGQQASAAGGGGSGKPPTQPPAGQGAAQPPSPPPGPNANLAQILASSGGPNTLGHIPDHAGRTVASKLAWNMHKTMSSWGKAGQLVADLLYDDVLNPGKVSVESERAAALAQLKQHQHKFMDMFRERMKQDGWGTWEQLTQGRGYYNAQRKLEQDLYVEMAARQNATATGAPHVSTRPDLKELADQLDLIHREALDELKRAGVENAADLKESSGYLSRKWDMYGMEQTIQRLDGMGLNGREAVAHMLQQSILARTPLLPADVALEMAKAIRDRTLRKGYFEDNIGQGVPDAVKATVIDGMNKAGVPDSVQKAVLDALDGTQDANSGPRYLKSRIGMDLLSEVTLPNGEKLRPIDLLDTSINRNVDQYLQKVATDAALARKGLGKASDVMALRSHLLHNIDPKHRADAAELFDNTMAYYKGLPSGAKVNENFRRIRALGSMTALSASGLWQLTEMATVLGKFGLGASLKVMASKMPGFRSLLAPQNAQALEHLLSDHSSGSIRLQPFMRRWEDLHDMSIGSQANRFDLFLESGQNLVPYANGMKFIHHMQAKLVANLMTQQVENAAKGHKKARALLQKMGVDDAAMARLEAAYAKHGLDIDAWDDADFDAIRPALIRGMDDFVLKQRLGGTPAFVAFNPVGKLLFTYRNFVLSAHNQILVQNLASRDGGALMMMMLYQYPLAVIAAQANAALRGDDNADPLKDALGQMGALGLLSEPIKWATGQSNAFGAPALIPIDTGIKLGQQLVHGAGYKAAGTAIKAAPLISILPGVKGLGAAVSNLE